MVAETKVIMMTIERRFIEEKIREMDAREMLRGELESVGYAGCQIKRTPMGTHVIIRAMRPGLVIGAGGENVDKLTRKLSDLKLDNPHIEVQAVEAPDLDSRVVAWKIGRLLERGFYFKSVAMRTLERTLASGARGVEIRITGKVPSSRAKKWCFKQGYIRHCGETVKEHVVEGKYTAMLRSGMLGVKVRIMPPNIIFPDEIKVKALEGEVAITAPKVLPTPVVSGTEEDFAMTEEDLRVEPTEEKVLEEVQRDKGELVPDIAEAIPEVADKPKKTAHTTEAKPKKTEKTGASP